MGQSVLGSAYVGGREEGKGVKIPANMSSLNSSHPFSNFATAGIRPSEKGRTMLDKGVKTLFFWSLTPFSDILLPDGLLLLFGLLCTLDQWSEEVLEFVHRMLLHQAIFQPIPRNNLDGPQLTRPGN